jgi:hypothetical protein
MTWFACLDGNLILPSRCGARRLLIMVGAGVGEQVTDGELVFAGGHSGDRYESEELVGDQDGRRCAVQGDRAVPERLGLENGSALTDLLTACRAPARWMEGIMGPEPGLLGRLIDMEQEHPVKKIQEFVLIPGDAADEHRFAVPGQGFR